MRAALRPLLAASALALVLASAGCASAPTGADAAVASVSALDGVASAEHWADRQALYVEFDAAVTSAQANAVGDAYREHQGTLDLVADLAVDGGESRLSATAGSEYFTPTLLGDWVEQTGATNVQTASYQVRTTGIDVTVEYRGGLDAEALSTALGDELVGRYGPAVLHWSVRVGDEVAGGSPASLLLD